LEYVFLTVNTFKTNYLHGHHNYFIFEKKDSHFKRKEFTMDMHKYLYVASLLFLNGVSFFSFSVHAQSQWENAIRFAGTNGYIMVPDTASLRIQDAITITAYVKRTRLDNIEFILEKGGDWSIGDTDYGISLHSVNNRMFYFIFHGGWRGTSGVADTNWHHYAVVTYTGDPDPTFYIDGVERPSEFGEGANAVIMNPATHRPLYIGAQMEPGATYYSANVIDEVTIWNRELDSLQIRSIMMDTLASAYYSSPDSGLVGYWRFDIFEDLGINADGTDDLRDLSYTSDHGDANGDLALFPHESLTAVNEEIGETPSGFELMQNSPNPFSSITTISFCLPVQSDVSLTVSDLTGRVLGTLISEELSPGNYSMQWNASGLPGGIYYYRMQAGSFTGTKKLVLWR
jgi:hypothetical protein